MKLLNRKEIVLLIAGFLIGLCIPLLFLANMNKRATEYEKAQKLVADSLIYEGRKQVLLARKKEMHWMRVTDSLNHVIANKPKIIYKDIDEKINTRTRSLTDVQLDSILSNYRFEPLSKAGDR